MQSGDSLFDELDGNAKVSLLLKKARCYTLNLALQ